MVDGARRPRSLALSPRPFGKTRRLSSSFKRGDSTLPRHELRPDVPSRLAAQPVHQVVGPPDAQQGARDHRLLLADQGALHDGRRDLRRQPQRKPRPRPDQHQLHHGGAADRRPRLPVPGEEVRARHLLAGGGPDQRRRHPGQRQPGRKLRRHPGNDDDRLQRDPDLCVRQSGTRSSARSPSTPSSPPGARPSTGWRSSSPSPSAPRPATSSPSSSNSATCRRWGSSPARSSSSPSSTSACRLNAILSFWLAYILTRPLGASIGDYLASPTDEGGLGLGTNLTSIIFLSTILALVVFLAISKRDVIRSGPARGRPRASPGRGARRSSSSSTRSRRPRRCSTR